MGEQYEKREFEIAIGVKSRRTVSGIIVGPLGVHRTSTGWRVTHLASGFAVCDSRRDFAEKDDALAVAVALKDEDWSGSRSAVQRRRGLSTAVTKAYRSIPDARKAPAGEP